MKNIGIITGEDSDLPQNLVKKYDITVFPYIVSWEKLSGGKNIYEIMRNSKGSGPKTSQPSPKVFCELFEKKLEEYKNVLVITVSSKFSGTYNSANQALKLLNPKDRARVRVIDSESGSGAEGLLILEATKLISENNSMEVIVKGIKNYIPKLNLVGVFDDPKWLVLGGRISSIKGVLVKNMLKGGFRPVLTIRDGEIVVKKIQMNAKSSPEALFNQFADEADPKRMAEVVITHADCPKDAEKLSNLLAKFSQSVKIRYVHGISQVIGAHLGPDTLLLSWTQV